MTPAPTASPENADGNVAALSIQSLQKTYKNGQQALKGIDLTVDVGEFYALLGPNGAGKTTAIGIITSLVNKSAGEVRVFGHDLDRELEAAKACIGLVPQEVNLNQWELVGNIVMTQAGYYGLPRKLARERAEKYLKALRLWDRRDEPARNLSGGMKRRLMIARALVHEPKLLILDEPTAGVDIELRRQLWDYVRALHARGATIVLTTHYLEEAQELCDEIAIIDHGAVAACEPTAALLSRLDKKTLVIMPVEPLGAIPDSLRDFEADLRGDGALAVTYRPGVDSVAEIIERYRASGARIDDLKTEEPDLEDVFMALTYGRSGAGDGSGGPK